MKILYIVTGLGTGGAERQVLDIADMMSSKGHSIKIVSLSKKLDTGLIPAKKEISVEYLDMKKTILSFIRVYYKLRQIIKNYQPNIIHSHMFHANLMARLLRITVFFPKLICSAHSNNEGGRLRMFMYRLTNKLADINTNVSKNAVEEFIRKKGFSPSQICVMNNGINTIKFQRNNEYKLKIRKELNISSSTYVFLAVGRLTEAKNYPNLLNAFSIVKKNKNNVHLLIVGVGELEQSLKHLCSDLNLENSVTFLGLRHDIPIIMNVADTYVLSSDFEGFSLVLGEAMATERVVIATDCGGPAEVVGKYGFIIPSGNSTILADKMLETISFTQEERKILGSQARSHIKQHYSLEFVTDKWIALYQG